MNLLPMEKQILINQIHPNFNPTQSQILLSENENMKIYQEIKETFESNQDCQNILKNSTNKILCTLEKLMTSIGLGVKFKILEKKYDSA